MGVGVVLEPLVVIALLLGGTWINRVPEFSLCRGHARRRTIEHARSTSPDSVQSGYTSPSPKDGLLSPPRRSPSSETLDKQWQKRPIEILGLSCHVVTPDTAVFQDRPLSRVLQRLPFLVECWYWALVYWVSLNRSSPPQQPDTHRQAKRRHISSDVHLRLCPSKKGLSMSPGAMPCS